MSACLAGVPGVAAVRLESQRGSSPPVYLVDAEHPSVAEVVAGAVITAGFGLLSLESMPVDLEALFLKLTGDRAEAGG